MLHVVNDNKLGSHVIYERTVKPPMRLDFPAKPKIGFRIKVPSVPSFHTEPLGWNPGSRTKPSNQYINNYQKTMTKDEPTTSQPPIDSLFRL